MDPFEEFEFKPLTDGLGFHKRKSELHKKAASLDPLTPVEASLLKNQGLNLDNAPREPSKDPLEWPLPRREGNKGTGSIQLRQQQKQDNQVLDDILDSLKKQKRIDAEIQDNLKKEKSPAKASIDYKPIIPQFGPILLDTMLVLASFLLCMVILLMITKIDLIKNLGHPDDQYLVYYGMFAVLAAVAFIYLVINRAFIGCTPGEWAYDQQVGTPREYLEWKYIPCVAFRAFLNIASAFILLPLLSMFMGEDVAGVVSGTRLYERK